MRSRSSAAVGNTAFAAGTVAAGRIGSVANSGAAAHAVIVAILL